MSTLESPPPPPPQKKNNNNLPTLFGKALYSETETFLGVLLDIVA